MKALKLVKKLEIIYRSCSKEYTPYIIYDASNESNSGVEHHGSRFNTREWILKRIPKSLTIKHADQAVAIVGDLTQTTLYTTNLATCIGLIIFCPDTSYGCVAHISDYFVGILAMEHVWGQQYMTHFLRHILSLIRVDNSQSASILLVGESLTDSNELFMFERLFYTYVLWTVPSHGRKQEMKESPFESFLKCASNAWKKIDREFLNIKQETVNELLVAQSELMHGYDIFRGAKNAWKEGKERWINLVNNAGLTSGTYIRLRFFPAVTLHSMKFMDLQGDGAQKLIDYIQNIESTLNVELNPHLNLHERKHGLPLSTVLYRNQDREKIEIGMWRENASPLVLTYHDGHKHVKMPVHHFSLGRNISLFRKMGMFITHGHSQQVGESELFTIDDQQTILRIYI